jgi:hypothetical protein
MFRARLIFIYLTVTVLLINPSLFQVSSVPGDSASNAISISTGVLETNSLPGPATDGGIWFKTNLNMVGTYRINLTSTTGNYFNLYVFDTNEVFIASNKSSVEEKLTLLDLQSGIHSLKINTSTGSGSFDLRIDQLGLSVDTAIPLGFESVQGELSASVEVVYYNITIPSTMHIAYRAFFIDSPLDIGLFLQNSIGDFLTTDVNTDDRLVDPGEYVLWAVVSSYYSVFQLELSLQGYNDWSLIKLVENTPMNMTFDGSHQNYWFEVEFQNRVYYEISLVSNTVPFDIYVSGDIIVNGSSQINSTNDDLVKSLSFSIPISEPFFPAIAVQIDSRNQSGSFSLNYRMIGHITNKPLKIELFNIYDIYFNNDFTDDINYEFWQSFTVDHTINLALIMLFIDPGIRVFSDYNISIMDSDLNLVATTEERMQLGHEFLGLQDTEVIILHATLEPGDYYALFASPENKTTWQTYPAFSLILPTGQSNYTATPILSSELVGYFDSDSIILGSWFYQQKGYYGEYKLTLHSAASNNFQISIILLNQTIFLNSLLSVEQSIYFNLSEPFYIKVGQGDAAVLGTFQLELSSIGASPNSAIVIDNVFRTSFPYFSDTGGVWLRVEVDQISTVEIDIDTINLYSDFTTAIYDENLTLIVSVDHNEDYSFSLNTSSDLFIELNAHLINLDRFVEVMVSIHPQNQGTSTPSTTPSTSISHTTSTTLSDSTPLSNTSDNSFYLINSGLLVVIFLATLIVRKKHR